jgi:hypothetical protein
MHRAGCGGRAAPSVCRGRSGSETISFVMQAHAVFSTAKLRKACAFRSPDLPAMTSADVLPAHH